MGTYFFEVYVDEFCPSRRLYYDGIFDGNPKVGRYEMAYWEEDGPKPARVIGCFPPGDQIAHRDQVLYVDAENVISSAAHRATYRYASYMRTYSPFPAPIPTAVNHAAEPWMNSVEKVMGGFPAPIPTAVNHSAAFRAPIPTAVNHPAAFRAPIPTAANHPAAFRAPIPTAVNHPAAFRAPIPTAVNHPAAFRAPIPTAVNHSAAFPAPRPTAANHSAVNPQSPFFKESCSEILIREADRMKRRLEMFIEEDRQEIRYLKELEKKLEAHKKIGPSVPKKMRSEPASGVAGKPGTSNFRFEAVVELKPTVGIENLHVPLYQKRHPLS